MDSSSLKAGRFDRESGFFSCVCDWSLRTTWLRSDTLKDKASIFDCILPSEAAISSAGDCDSELADENDLMRIRELAIIKQAITPIIIFFNFVTLLMNIFSPQYPGNFSRLTFI